ncbi:MAG: hypothetical protein AAGN66_00455 [Acidobacteriota bacterium]
MTRSARLCVVLALVLAPAVPPPVSAGAGTPCPVEQASEELAQVGQAMFSWLVDQVGTLRFPLSVEPYFTCDNGGVSVDLYPVITHAALEALLEPDYIAEVPELDPWGNPYEYRLDTAAAGGRLLAIRSAGSDGVWEGTTYAAGATAVDSEDLVWADGVYMRFAPRLDPTSRQELTSEQLRVIGTAFLSWLVDQVSDPGAAPVAGGAAVVGAPRGTYDLGILTELTHAEARGLLIPSPSFYYIRCLPELDGWGRPLEFRLADNIFGAQVVSIRSAGSDGVLEGTVYEPGSFPPDDDASDLVWADGFYVRWFDGPRSGIFADDFETGGTWGTWSTCSE